MRRLRYSAISLLLGVFFALPNSTHAAVTTNYDGCFDFTATANGATVHMLQLVCTITLTNDSSTTTWNATVANLDPHYYIVRQDGEPLSNEEVTYNHSKLQFSIALTPNQSTTIKIRPWEDLDKQDQMTIFAGSDPQNTNNDDVPNPIFVDFMEYAETINQLLFVIASDVIKGSTTDTAQHEFEYKQMVALLQKTPVTVVASIGDHDARQEYTEYFERYMGPIPRVVSYNKHLDFFLINSVETVETEGEITDETMEWLENELSRSTAEYKVVVLQDPFDVPNGASASGIVEEDKLPLAQLLTEYDVQVAFVGDAHWYDVDTIDSTTEDYEGLIGSFLQIVMGGLGGKIEQYQEVHPNTADHFMMMITFGDPEDDDGITYTRLAQDDLDITKEEKNKNDGTEESITVKINNSGTAPIPVMRVKFFGTAPNNNTYYAFLSDGRILNTVSQQFGTQKRGYVELTDVAAQKSFDVTMATVHTPYQGVTNSYKKDGTMEFSTLPTSTSKATEISVLSAQASGTITVDEWNPTLNIRDWTEHAGSKDALTQYTISGLEPYRSYAVKVNEDMKSRQTADVNGEITFDYSGSKTRSFSVMPETGLHPANFGVLPAEDGTAHMRLYGQEGNLVSNFIAYSRSLNHGFESTWIDADDDGGLELALVPAEGATSHVILYEKDGTRKAAKYPFGKDFSQGVNLVSADIEGTGKEIVIAAPKDKQGQIRLYEYRASSGKLVKIKTKKPFGKKFRGGINVDAADVNGDGDDEIVVSTRSQEGKMRVYNWKPKKRKLKLIDGARVHSNDTGVTIAAGDVDFDGRDEIVAGTQTGNGQITVIDYKKKKKKLVIKKTKTAFKNLDGGVQVDIANVNKKKRFEIIVSPSGGEDSSSTIKVYNYTSKNKLKKAATVKPFGKGYTKGFSVSFADTNLDQKMEMAVAGKEEKGKVNVYRKGKKKMKKMYGYRPYGKSFTSGLHLTN